MEGRGCIKTQCPEITRQFRFLVECSVFSVISTASFFNFIYDHADRYNLYSRLEHYENFSISTLIVLEALIHPSSDLGATVGRPQEWGMALGTSKHRCKIAMKSNLMRAADFVRTANNKCSVLGNKADSFRRCCADRMNVYGYCKRLRGVDLTLRHIMMPFTTLQE